MPISRQTLMLGAAAVLILGGAYWYFFTGSASSPLSTIGTTTPEAAQFLDLAGELTPVSFDTSIFSDPRFTSLIDIETPITPEGQGRIDPFAPIGK